MYFMFNYTTKKLYLSYIGSFCVNCNLKPYQTNCREDSGKNIWVCSQKSQMNSFEFRFEFCRLFRPPFRSRLLSFSSPSVHTQFEWARTKVCTQLLVSMLDKQMYKATYATTRLDCRLGTCWPGLANCQCNALNHWSKLWAHET